MKLRAGDKFAIALLVIFGGLWLGSYIWGFRLIVRYDDSLVIESSRGDLHVGHTGAPMTERRVRIELLPDEVSYLFTGSRVKIRNEVFRPLPRADLYRQYTRPDRPSARGIIVPHAYFVAAVVSLWAAMWGWRWRRRSRSRRRSQHAGNFH